MLWAIRGRIIKIKGVVKIFLVFSFFLLCVIAMYAKDRASYKEANSLIKEKKQEVAIEKILEMLETHPESFNSATDSLKKAMKNQDKFVAQFLAIIAQLYKDPENNQRILQIIARIERLNTAIDPELEEFLQKLKSSSLYAANRIKFNKIMKEGIDLIKGQLYSEALAKFMEGYSISYSEYVELYENTERLTKTEEAIKAIRGSYGAFRREDFKFLNSINAYKLMLRQNILKPDASVISAFEEDVKQLHAISQSVLVNGNILSSFLSQDEKDSNFQADSFLPYATRVTTGRATASEYEGVSGTLEAALLLRLSSLQDYILSLIQRTYSNNFAKFKFGLPFDSSLNEVVGKYLKEYERIIGLIENINKTNTRFPLNQKENRDNLALLSNLNTITNDSLTIYEKYLAINKNDYKVDDYGKEGNVGDIKELDSLIFQIVPMQSRIIAFSFERFSKEKADLINIQAQMFAGISDLYQNRLANYARVKNIDGKRFYKEHETQFNSTKKLVEGNASFTDQSSEAYYPTEALARLDKQAVQIKKDIKMLEDAVDFLSHVSQDFDPNLTTKTHFDGIQDSEQKLSALLANLSAISTSAKNSIFRMELAKREADFRYNEAVRMLKASDFTLARENITRSQEKSNEALKMEDNAEYRAMVDARLSALGQEINQKENEMVVREVRKSIDYAKKLYFNGNFGEAENILLSAKSRWAATNIEDNEEIQNWLNIAQTASVMKTGRSIPQSAALYPQMIQLLNNAKQLYDEASGIIKTERKTALTKLNEARNNIKQVLLVYPLNEESGQLNLRIDQLIDPENFSIQVKKRIDRIRIDYRRNPQSSYAELLNLYIMDRNFPGIAKLKDEVEIYLGLKILPPDLTQVNQSVALTSEADSIYKSGDKSKYNLALQKLDQAIKLNQNNERASILKDRIQMAMGGTAIAVLSYANEEKYRQAVLALQRGNKITAIALVEELLRDPEARKSAKVHDLKTRINAQL
ncbi:MAG: hypothetical protein ACTTKH_01225 [Treponema sp.]